MDSLDESIILLAKQGNLSAFEQMVLHYERPIYSYIYRLCGHSQTAEDLTQETIIKLYKNLGSLNSKENITSWIFTIATHIFYDFLRKKKHIQELFIIDDPEAHFETIDENNTYTLVEETENLEIIDNALKALKPEYKTVLLLFYRHDLSYESIASTLKIPLNTVKTYLFRAKKMLKDNLWINSQKK